MCCPPWRVPAPLRQAMEWDILAAWVVSFQLHSDNNVWLIQVRRWSDCVSGERGDNTGSG